MISEKNTRIKVTISKKTYGKLKDLADYEGRSVSNLVAYIIKDFLRKTDSIK